MDSSGTDRVSNEQLPQSDQFRIQVEFNNGMWWEMPLELSSQLLQTHRSGFEEASYVWDWGGTRQGSCVIEGESTSLNRYVINFRTMLQQNSDNQRTRRVRIVKIFEGQ